MSIFLLTYFLAQCTRCLTINSYFLSKGLLFEKNSQFQRAPRQMPNCLHEVTGLHRMLKKTFPATILPSFLQVCISLACNHADLEPNNFYKQIKTVTINTDIHLTVELLFSATLTFPF